MIYCLSSLIRYDNSSVEAEVAQEYKSCLTDTFRLHHVIEVVFHKIEHIKGPALYLELVEAHGNILVPYIIRSYVCAERLYVIKAPVLTLTFKYSLCLRVLLCEPVRIKGSIGVFPYVVGIGYLLGAYCLIVERTVHAAGIAAGVYKYLALFLVGYLFEDIELVVEVVIEDNYMVILFDFLVKSFRVGYSFAGGACELEAGIVLSYVVLKYGRYHDTFIHSVVGDVHYHIAEFIAEMFLFKHGIGKGKAEWYALAVEMLGNSPDEVLLAHTVHNPSAVPE